MAVHDANRAWHGDTVVMSLEGVVLEILTTSRHRDQVVGYIRLDDKQKYGVNKKGVPIYLFHPLSHHYPCMHVACSASQKYPRHGGCVYILARFLEWTVEQKMPRGQCEDVLGMCGDEIADALARAHYHRLWDGNGRLAHVMMDDAPPEKDEEMVVDMTHEQVFSIDPPGCVDIDDAIHVREKNDNTYEIGIHIADVTRFIPPGSAVDLEAQHRCYTTYLPHKQVPIIPEALAHHACSLHAFHDRYTLSCLVEWRDGKVVSSKFMSGKIRSRGALTYDDVDAKNVPNANLIADIQLLCRLVQVDDGDSHVLIEKLMLLANMEAAKHLMRHGEGLFRRHQQHVESWLMKPAEYLHHLRGDGKQLRHDSLGVDLYTHFTSPIRRYADQIVHRLLLKQRQVHTTHSVVSEEVVARLNEMQRKHRRFQRDMQILEHFKKEMEEDDEAVRVEHGVVAAFRYSDSKLHWKVDIALPRIKLVCPLQWINRKTQWMFISNMSDDQQTLSIVNTQTKEVVQLKLGQQLHLRMTYRPREPTMHKKCVVMMHDVGGIGEYSR